MEVRRTKILNAGLVVLSFLLAAALYGPLPDPVPTHWNAAGEVDGYTPKPWGPFVLPLAMAGTYLLLSIVPRISPRGYGIERFRGAFEIMQSAILAFLLFVTAVALGVAVGVPVTVGRAVTFGIGLLFVVLGNFMGKVTKNFFVGIRTPWTLASDEVWLRTHRLGGKLFVVAGLLLVLSALLNGGLVPLLAAVTLVAVVPTVYSYVLYRRLEGAPPTAPGAC